MKIKNGIFLALAAFIFGISFVAQDEASTHISPFTFNCVRFFIAACVLAVTSAVYELIRKKTGRTEPVRKRRKTLIAGGLLCGAALCGAITFQQFGFMDPNMTSGKAGFISACYILIVPVAGLFFRRRPTVFVWIGVALALVGLYFLCLGDGFALSWGDALEMGCALTLALHILLCDYFAPRCDSLKLTCIQCLVCALVSLPFMLLTERPAIGDVLDAALPILFCGILSSGAAYTFQLLGQNGANPTIASMIMSFESVFAVIAGAVILGQIMTVKQIIGCAVIFAALVLAQIPGRKRKAAEETVKETVTKKTDGS